MTVHDQHAQRSRFPDGLIVASTTLSANSAEVIGDALRSVVDWVDICLVIDTGITDQTLEIAQQIAGDKLQVRSHKWTNDFSAARNFAIDAATECGADWAVTLDTDERIHANGEDLRAAMRFAGGDDRTEAIGVLMTQNTERTYDKLRFLRLPCSERYSGPTHESISAFKLGQRTLERATFSELQKSPEDLKRKFMRDLSILRDHISHHPLDPRWHYYLGDSLRNLGQYSEAVDAYDTCAALRGWNEESAWACYQAADCLVQLGNFSDAVERCATGLTRHAGIAELCWLAGFASYQSGDYVQCIYWARLAITQGLAIGTGRDVPRIGFRNPVALYEGPYDLLRFALAKIGDAEGAADAEARFNAAKAERTGTSLLRPFIVGRCESITH
jgi:glycosyltransferase involved in cell wall biosynthesis